MKKKFTLTLLVICLFFGGLCFSEVKADEFTEQDHTHIYSGGWIPLYGEPAGTGTHWTSYKIFQAYKPGIYAYIRVHGYNPVIETGAQSAYARDWHRVGPYAPHTHDYGSY